MKIPKYTRNIEISYFSSFHGYGLKQTTLYEFLSGVVGGYKRQQIEEIRSFCLDDPKRDELKDKLDGCTLSGTFSKKSNAGLIDHSGCIQVDIDLKDNPGRSYEDLLSIVKENRHVFCAFKSPSGGVKAIAKIDASAETHKDSWLKLAAQLGHDGVVLDSNTKDISRFCFYSYDPDLWIASEEDYKAIIEPTSFDAPSQSYMESGVVGSPKSLKAQKPKSLKKPLISLPPSHETLADREARQARYQEEETQALEDLKKDKLRFTQYHSLVAKYAHKATNTTSNRNSLTLEIVSFLFENVGETSVEPLAMAFYDLNKSHFSGNTSRDEHRAEVSKQIKCVSERWHASLNEIELEYFSALDCPYQQNLFRICRRLASVETEEFPAGVFHLSEKKAAERLGTAQRTGGAKLGDLRKVGIISIKKKGTNGKIRSKRLATTYNWLLDQTS
jgi:hypothetical protein